MTREKLVIIGNGMAGTRTLEELLKLAPDKYAITVFGAEPYGNYNRILLSPVLAGDKTLADIMLNDPAWYAERGITLHTGKTVVRINRRARQVVAADGTTADYDRLLLATGSEPLVLPVPGHTLDGVLTFRDIGDVNSMLVAANNHRRALVIGGGLLGLEAACGLRKRGMEVSVAHLRGHLLERQLDVPAARLLQRHLEARGLTFHLNAQTEAIAGTERVQAVHFKDDRCVPADLVIMAVGIRPNMALAQKAGLHCERGIAVNDTLQSYDPRIYAVGECVQHRGRTYGLVAPLWEQARVCANHLAAMGIARFLGAVPSTSLKVTGIDLFSAGDINGVETDEKIVFQDPAFGIYKKLVIRGNRLIGVVLYGDIGDGGRYLELIRSKTDIRPLRAGLIFGQIELAA